MKARKNSIENLCFWLFNRIIKQGKAFGFWLKKGHFRLAENSLFLLIVIRSMQIIICYDTYTVMTQLLTCIGQCLTVVHHPC